MIARAGWDAGERGEAEDTNPFETQTHDWFVWRRWWRAGRDTYNRQLRDLPDGKTKREPGVNGPPPLPGPNVRDSEPGPPTPKGKADEPATVDQADDGKPTRRRVGAAAKRGAKK